MPDESNSGMADSDCNKSRLRLVDHLAEQRKESRLSEPATNELREMIEAVQQRNTPRKKHADDDVLPPAA